mmetsp:Transcript_77654/g.251473  ORF Transcript_77654/g.251473 Transcript_77654/m.251473 type:complete len:468 (-) Transcript_77654:38-1441(-)
MDPSLVRGSHAGGGAQGVYHGGTKTQTKGSIGTTRKSKGPCCAVPTFGLSSAAASPAASAASIGPSARMPVSLTSGAGASGDPFALPASGGRQAGVTQTAPQFGGGQITDERTKLLEQAMQRVDRRPPLGMAQHFQSVGAMVLWPWLAFVAVIFALALLPPERAGRIGAWAITFAALGLSLLLVQVFFYSKAPIYKYLGLLGILAVCLAGFSGRMIYDRTTLQYWLDKERTSQSGVLPSQSTAAVMDAAAVTFVEGTKVDLRQDFRSMVPAALTQLCSHCSTTPRHHGYHHYHHHPRRVLGYRSAQEDPGVTYCVAPVMDMASAEANEARYWAVGTNCCEPAWGFTCGDALSPVARSGLVIRNIPGSEHASLRHRLFLQAATQAAAMYSLGMGDVPVFVHWSEDAEAELNRDLKLSALYCVILSLFHLMFSIFCGGYLHWQTRRKDWQQPAKQLTLPVMARYNQMAK